MQTNYPFSQYLTYIIKADVDFDLYVRLPECVAAHKSTAQFSGGEGDPMSPSDGLHRLNIKSGLTKLFVHLHMNIRTVIREGAVAVYRGPLLYSADIEHTCTPHRPLNFDSMQPLPEQETDERCRDWVLEPTSEWRYAIDPSTIRIGHTTPHDAKLPDPVFDRKNSPVSLEVDAYPIDWPEVRGTAGLPPVNPKVDRSTRVTLKLIPFGAAKLHIAQFPVAKLE